jgi:flagellar FliL protein
MRMASAAKSGAGRRKDEDEGEAPAAAPAPRTRGPLPLILGSALLAAAMSGGVSWFMLSRHAPPAAEAGAKDGATDKDKEKDKAAAEQPAVYLDLTPAFVVNLADEESMRFLQIEVELMARDQKVLDAAKNNLPRIRNALVMLFSQQHSHDLATREAKENLQKQALVEVQKALQDENAPDGIAAVYFTSFVMQ